MLCRPCGSPRCCASSLCRTNRRARRASALSQPSLCCGPETRARSSGRLLTSTRCPTGRPRTGWRGGTCTRRFGSRRTPPGRLARLPRRARSRWHWPMARREARREAQQVPSCTTSESINFVFALRCVASQRPTRARASRALVWSSPRRRAQRRWPPTRRRAPRLPRTVRASRRWRPRSRPRRPRVTRSRTRPVAHARSHHGHCTRPT
mmetsp:Transcript_10004/g.41469  ORF Transcript_10004/g.41469 Transcript_10004/m.41469 type:complete len:208 (-) Transcript_10004:3057-3680(-)